MSVLITGGAGYIGSHMTLELADRGDKIVVLDNLTTGVRAQVAESATFVQGDIRERFLGVDTSNVADVLDLFPDVRGFLRRQASSLSGGQQRMVAIARTLLGNPTLLLLDEPSEGLAPLVVQALLDRLRRLKETGATVLLAEQNLRFATELADRIYIIERGEIRYEGRPGELAAHPEVREKYLMV